MSTNLARRSPASSLGQLVLPGPGNLTIEQVAQSDPQLAYALLPPSPLRSTADTLESVLVAQDQALACPSFVLRSIPICRSFTPSGSNAEAPASAAITEGKAVSAQLFKDIWIRKIDYVVRRPNAFADSIFKAQSDAFNKLNPNVDITLTVRSYTDYVIASTPTPLETIEMVFECLCPIGFVLGCTATVDVEFFLRRALRPDENPYEVCVVLWGITLPRTYNISLQVAVAELSARGIDCCM